MCELSFNKLSKLYTKLAPRLITGPRILQASDATIT